MALYRLTEKKMISGVMAGIAEKLMWDPSLVRLGAVFVTICTGIWPGVITYVAAAIIIPDKDKVTE